MFCDLKENLKKLQAVFCCDFWKHAFDLRLHTTVIPIIILLILLYPAVLYLPEWCGWENRLFENLQLFILFNCCFIWVFVKEKRRFFIFAAMIFFIMILRETNFGKTLFFPHPTRPNAFLNWKEIWYAPYVDPVMAVYGIAVAVYFFAGKVYRELTDLILTVKIPVWDTLLFAITVAGAQISDGHCGLIMEEGVETVMYCSLFVLLSTAAFRPALRHKQ